MSTAKLERGIQPATGGIGTVPAYYTDTLTFASTTDAASVDFNFRNIARQGLPGTPDIFMNGDFWLKIQETATSPENEDDVDIQWQPMMVNAAGTLSTTQQAAQTFAEAADFDTARLHGYSLNEVMAEFGTKSQFLGGDGGRLTILPSAALAATFKIELIVR